jgi:hypothetical protein
LSSYNGIVKGVVPGDPDNSQIVRAIRSGSMPKKRSKLSQAEIDLVAEWTKNGAKAD